MRMHTLAVLVFVCGYSAMPYADSYTSPVDANSPPTTFEDDPAATNNVHEANPVQQPLITVPIQKNPSAYDMDNPNPDTPPTPDELPQENPNPQPDDVGTTPSQPS